MARVFRLTRGFVAALVATAVAAVPVRALTPRDELLRLVSEDVGFCLVVQDLRGHLDRLRDSPFVEQWRTSPLGQAVAQAPETQKLAEVAKNIRERFQVDWLTLGHDVLGEAVVLAYWPGPDGREDQERGVVLVRAAKPQLLAGLMNQLNQAQPQTEVRKYGETEYVSWGKGQGFYYLRGPVLAFSKQEEAVRRVIDLDRTASATAEPPVTGHLHRLGMDKTLAVLWLNPRVFEAEIQRKAAQASGPEAFVLNTVLTYWKALDGIALYGKLPKTELELGIVIQVRPERLPAPARRLLVKEVRPSDLWRYFPDNALLAVAGRVDAVAVAEFIGSFLPGEVRAALRETVDRGPGAVLGRDVVGEVLPCVGPDWGFCLLAPPAAGDVWVPYLVAALRIQPGNTGVPLDRTALEALNTAALLGVVTYNGSHPDRLRIQTEMQGKVEVRSLVNDKLFLPGFAPAYALKDGYLIVASSPEAIRSFHALAAPNASEKAAEIPLVRMSLAECRRYLKDRTDALAPYIAEKSQLPRDEVVRRLQGLVSVLDLLDRFEVCQRSSSDQVSLIVRLRPSQPLGK